MKKLTLILFSWFFTSQVFAVVESQYVGLYIQKPDNVSISEMNSICLVTAKSGTVCGNNDLEVNNPKAWKITSKHGDYFLVDESCKPYLFWQLTPRAPYGIKLYLKLEKHTISKKEYRLYLNSCVLA